MQDTKKSLMPKYCFFKRAFIDNASSACKLALVYKRFKCITITFGSVYRESVRFKPEKTSLACTIALVFKELNFNSLLAQSWLVLTTWHVLFCINDFVQCLSAFHKPFFNLLLNLFIMDVETLIAAVHNKPTIWYKIMQIGTVLTLHGKHKPRIKRL